ncbi:MAG: regulatory protein ArsR [Bacteroidota bacterium]|nr:regulatory protein ArsR [Bacteroidota bacterium]
MATTNKLINTKQLDSASSVVRALAHPLRMKILSFIDANRKINVNKIYKSLKVEQSIASQHLRIMRDDGLVKAERKGKFIFYTVNYRKLGQIEKAIEKFEE